MSNVGKWLRDADPVAAGHQNERLPPAEAQAMRRTIVAAADERPPACATWPQPLVVGATIAMTVAAGVMVCRQLPHSRDVSDGVETAHLAPASDQGAPARRQVQFVTPGGTRVIWVFNSAFEP